MGLRRSFWIPFFGLPRGPLGRLGAAVMPRLVRPLYRMMAAELALQPEDVLLDVGCGSAAVLADDASQVGHVAGLDASPIQVRLARRRLAARIAAGTAEVALGDAMRLPWEDGAFTVVCSLNCLKFVPDPGQALREMRRVLRPGGRAILTVDEPGRTPVGPNAVDAFGQRQWSADAARQMMEEAGFTDVSVTHAPTRFGLQLLRGVVPAPVASAVVAEPGVLVR